MQAVWWILGIIVALSLIGLALWRIAVISQRPRKIANAPAPDAGNAEWRAVSFNSGDAALEGWLLLPKAGSGGRKERSLPLVIVAHGWGSNRTRVMRYVRPLCEAGYAVMVYDARGHGDSASFKAPSAFMFRDDLLAAAEAARRLPEIDSERLMVLGHSIGGFGALLALAEGLKAKAVITDSMPAQFETMMRVELKRKKLPMFPLGYLIMMIVRIRSGVSREQFRRANIPDILRAHATAGAAAPDEGRPPDNEAEGGLTPVLMIHSDGDDFIPPDDLRRLAAELPEGTVRTLFVSSRGHSSSEQDPAFWRAVLPFADRYVRRGGPSRRPVAPEA